MSGPFSFLTATSRRQELVAQHVLREHASGRDLHDILEDAYVRNRCTPEEIGRLLDRPELVHAIGEHVIAAVRDTFARAA
jgi:hypothetical protein